MRRAVVVGGGIGGLSAACKLALDGFDVQVFEAAAEIGGKMARRHLDGRAVDTGPSVLTLPEVFEGLFAQAGESLYDHVTATRMPELASHLWPEDGANKAIELRLYHDVEQSADAIGQAFGQRARAGYLRYAAYSQTLWEAAKDVFVFGPKLSLTQLLFTYGRQAFRAVSAMDGSRTMHEALLEFFPETPQLRQIFGRYATYAGSSPFAAPATLHQIYHVERLGSYEIEGGLSALARAVADLAARLGVRLHTNMPVRRVLTRGGAAQGVRLCGGEDVMADVVLLNTDASLTPKDPLWFEEGPARHQRVERGLSALTSNMVGHISGLPPCAHTVLFGDRDERAEYQAIFEERRMPARPNVYLFAPDRGPLAPKAADGSAPERVFCIVNAPPTEGPFVDEDLGQWNQQLLAHLAQAGLTITPGQTPALVQSPTTFEQRFPRSGGLLYGQPAGHWRDFLRRPGSRTPVRHCLRVGGGVHPGAGVPMAALSGLLAAEQANRDFSSTSRFRLGGMRGGIWTQKATTGSPR